MKILKSILVSTLFLSASSSLWASSAAYANDATRNESVPESAAKKVTPSIPPSSVTTIWSPNKFNLVSQLMAEIDETLVTNDWMSFVRLHAGRLKSLNVHWDDFHSALFASVRFRTNLSVDEKSRVHYEEALNDAKPESIVNFNLPVNRSLETLTTKIWAVHTTDFFPQDKIGLTPLASTKFYFRPTIHFALGGMVRGHHGYSWEQKRYAVLVPLKELMPQLLNLMPQDSFIAGDFELPQSAIVLVPSQQMSQYNFKLVKAQVRIFDETKQTLRMAINETLKDKNAWLIKSHAENTTMLPRAYVDGVNIYQYPLFSEIQKRYPHLRFGSHAISIVETPTHAGIADNLDTISIAIASQLTDATSAFSQIAKIAFPELLKHIEQVVGAESIRESLAQRYQQIKPALERYLFSRESQSQLAIGNKNYFEAAVGHFLHGFDFQTAEKVILKMNEGSGLLSKQERILKQQIARMILLDLASGPLQGANFESVQELLEKSKAMPNYQLIADLIIRSSQATHENTLAFFLERDFGSYHILVKWLGFFQQTGFFEKMKKEAFTQISEVKNGLACIPANGNATQLVNVKRGWEIGGHFASMPYCLQAIADSTADLVCVPAPDRTIRIFSHATYPMIISVLRFNGIPACSRLLPSVLI